jgi:hypothetical protein
MRPVVFEWQASSATAVSTLQTVGAAGNLAIDGSLSSPVRPDSTNRLASFGNTQRTISLTSTNNLSAINFTISGYLNGQPVSQIIAGPNNNTVNTTQLFNTVTSISFSAGVTAVSAGIGVTGNTNLYTYDHHATTPDISVQVVVTGTITYSVDVTNDDANKPLPIPTWFNPITAMTNATTTQFGNIVYPIVFTRVSVSAGTGSLTATFVQQGLGDV